MHVYTNRNLESQETLGLVVWLFTDGGGIPLGDNNYRILSTVPDIFQQCQNE